MGSSYDHFSREELVALLSATARSADTQGKEPSSGDRYREMVEQAADGIFVADSRGIYLDVNEIGARMLGTTPYELVGRSIMEVVADSDQDALLLALGRVRAGEWVLHEWLMKRADGSVFPGEVSAKLLPDGRMQGILRDVTQRRRDVETLRQSEERFRALTAAAFEGIGISERGVIVDVNDQLAALLGYQRSELVGKDVNTMVAAESQEAVAAAMLSGQETSYRHFALRKDGSRIEVETRAKMAIWSGRRVRVTAVRDLTQRLQLEERLHSAHKFEALGRLAGGIAHDFNNILVAIFSYTDLATLDANEPEQVKAHMEGLRAGAYRARDLVQQILTFSRKKSLERTLTPVQPILKEALNFLRSTLPASIELTSRIEDSAPPILGEPIQIHQVIMNLCVNAAHAMQGQNGVLSVALEGVLPTPQLVRSAPELSAIQDYLRLTVTDTGTGMDAATCRHIFEPFFSTRAVGEGSGLGLAVVHGIVSAHEGVIKLQTEVGRGTTFEVYLPAVMPS